MATQTDLDLATDDMLAALSSAGLEPPEEGMVLSMLCTEWLVRRLPDVASQADAAGRLGRSIGQLLSEEWTARSVEPQGPAH